jgi:hypothetical protein
MKFAVPKLSPIMLLLAFYSCETKSNTSSNDENSQNNLMQICNTINNSSNFHDLNKVDSIAYSNIPNYHLLPKYNKYEDIYISNFFKMPYFDFRILVHHDESCCISSYVLTYDKRGNAINAIIIANNGSDADWSETDKVICNGDNSILVKKVIQEQNMNNRSNKYESKTIDSITVKHIFLKDGRINTSRLDSVRSCKNY